MAEQNFTIDVSLALQAVPEWIPTTLLVDDKISIHHFTFGRFHLSVLRNGQPVLFGAAQYLEFNDDPRAPTTFFGILRLISVLTGFVLARSQGFPRNPGESVGISLSERK